MLLYETEKLKMNSQGRAGKEADFHGNFQERKFQPQCTAQCAVHISMDCTVYLTAQNCNALNTAMPHLMLDAHIAPCTSLHCTAFNCLH